jgi:hypothetical protein
MSRYEGDWHTKPTLREARDWRGSVEEPTIGILSETENYSVWQAEEPDGETTYHLELGTVTMHFFREEWHEFLELVGELVHAPEG